MSSYMALRQIKPDLILSSLSLRAQMTADRIANKTDYKGRIHYMEELYMVRPETLINVISLQENQHETLFLVGHNPELTELGNMLLESSISKLPSLGIIGIKLDIENWSDIVKERRGDIDLFIYPKQFRYYMPRQIKNLLKEDE